MGANCFLGKWHPERRGDFSSSWFPLLSTSILSLSLSLLFLFSSFVFPQKHRERERERAAPEMDQVRVNERFVHRSINAGHMIFGTTMKTIWIDYISTFFLSLYQLNPMSEWMETESILSWKNFFQRSCTPDLLVHEDTFREEIVQNNPWLRK